MRARSESEWLAALTRLAVAADDDTDELVRALDQRGREQPLHAGQTRLLASVYPQLRRSAISTPLTALASKAYLSNWTTNRALSQYTAPVVDALEGGGCRPLLLKGAAMIASVHGDLGVRTISDVDVLVEPSRLAGAWQILTRHGGTPERRGRVTGVDACRQTGHAWSFEFDSAWNLDLHWSPLVDCCAEVIAERFLASARSASVNGLSWRVPSREHLLLHACVHGVRRDWLAPGRWMVDAATLVKRSSDLDWGVVFECAGLAGLGYAVSCALRRLEAMSLIDGRWRIHATRCHTSLAERVETWAWRRDQCSVTSAPLPRVLTHLARYRRLRRFHPQWSDKAWSDYWRLYRDEKAACAPREGHVR